MFNAWYVGYSLIASEIKSFTTFTISAVLSLWVCPYTIPLSTLNTAHVRMSGSHNFNVCILEWRSLGTRLLN